jgi:hypothetical protein
MSQFWEEKAPLKWNRFARAAIKDKNMDAWKTARLLAILNTALIDAFSSCIIAKYHYYYWRPETAINLGDEDGNPNTIGNPNWVTASRLLAYSHPLYPAALTLTARYPEYPSDQSTDGGAATEVLRLFFGADAASVDQTSITRPGVIRHYSSFSQASADCRESQILLGYDFRNSCIAGENMGKQIGAYVFNHNFR